MRFLVFVLLALSALLISALLSAPLGLGEKEDFVLYRLLGTSRSAVAFWATSAIVALLVAVVAVRSGLAWSIAAGTRRGFDGFKESLAALSRRAPPAPAGDPPGSPKDSIFVVVRRALSSAGQGVGGWFVDRMRRVRSYRPTAWDVVAMSIIAAYGVLCWKTLFQSYRNYEEVWTFETDGPFYVILLDLLAHGELNPSAYYGYFPILAAYLFSLPVRIVRYLFSSGDLITSLIIGFRISQIFFALLAGWLIYLITSLLASRPIAIVCLISFFSLSEVLRWTAYIHPDVQQVSMTLAGCYFLIKYLEDGQQRYFFVSAVFAGLATASKYFGAFLIPAAAVAAFAVCLPQNGAVAAIRRSVFLVLLYAGVHTVTYLLATPPVIRRPLNSLRYMTEFHSSESRIVFGNAFSADLWQRKARLLFDNAFLGRTICVAFVVAVIWTVVASLVRRRIDGVHVLTAVILSHFILFLALWGDVFNINGGYRYLLQPVALVPIVIAVALNDAGQHFGRPGRAAAVLAALWMLVLIVPYSLPTRVRHISELLTFYWTREQTGRFLIKNWIEENLPEGSRIMTQAYTNIQIPGHVPGHRYDQGSRWRGKKDIRVYYDPSNHVFLTLKGVASIDPDFILGINEREIKEILAAFPAYRLLTKVGESTGVFVLGKAPL